ncbi:unnamed protein product, partial [Rotaria sordida]
DGVASSSLHRNLWALNTSLLYLNVIVNNKKMKVMMDTGATRSFISIKTLDHPMLMKNLTKTNRHKFEWDASQSQVFSQLKQLLITSPLFLDFSDDNYSVILTMDASEIGIGGTLQQNIDDAIKNLYYHSQITSSLDDDDISFTVGGVILPFSFCCCFICFIFEPVTTAPTTGG